MADRSHLLGISATVIHLSYRFLQFFKCFDVTDGSKYVHIKGNHAKNINMCTKYVTQKNVNEGDKIGFFF